MTAALNASDAPTDSDDDDDAAHTSTGGVRPTAAWRIGPGRMWYDMYGVPIDATEDDLSRILQEVGGLAHMHIGGFRLGGKRRRDMARAQLLARGPHGPLLTKMLMKVICRQYATGIWRIM